VSPARYELGFYIPKNSILHSHRRENLKSYTYSICDRLAEGMWVSDNEARIILNYTIRTEEAVVKRLNWLSIRLDDGTA
jgi:hypothetical protein